MIMLWLSVEVRYGKFPFGASRWNSTVKSSVFLTPDGVSTPAKADSALEPFLGLVCSWKVYTTSSAVSGSPLWNLTPCRILNVHTSAVEFGDHEVASTGVSVRVCPDRHSHSPVCPSMSWPPWSSMVTGLMAAVGVTMPTLSTAPGAPVAVLPPLAVLGELLLQAASTDPSTGAEIPTTVARRTKSRRDSRPAAYSSMMWLAISPWPWRNSPSRR